MPRPAVITLREGDWARTRFVRSLLWETVQAVRTLDHPRQQLHHRAWLATVDRAAARARLPVLAALNPPSGWVPDFLAPPPHAGAHDVEVELAGVAAYPPEVAARDLLRSLRSHPSTRRTALLGPLVADPALGLERVAAELRWAWDELLAPFWPSVADLVEADVEHRSREIVRVGLGRAVADLHPDVSWHGATITVQRSDDVQIDLGGRGLALMPSAFAWPGVIVVHEPPWPPTLVYPARGVGELWSAPPTPPSGLAGVLGASRAELLVDLAVPATTTTLAARHRLGAATVSTHLSRLRAAGLVLARRDGKEVFYRRSPAGDVLVGAAGHR